MKGKGLRHYFETGDGLFAKRAVSLALAIWTGSIIGRSSLLMGAVAGKSAIAIDDFPKYFFRSPLALMDQWLPLNLLFVAVLAFWLFFYPATARFRILWILVAGEGVFSMVADLGWGRVPQSNLWVQGATWGTWAVMMAWVGSGLWIFHAWQRNHRARDLRAFEAENAQLKTEREREMMAKALAEELDLVGGA